ncbi:hypothetical protein [Deinococcus sp. Leaf326]|uniref:hypothetical protein n=1 Tax=Deinococcus sp. Leaf326 TaxID=1736338 RepID=UPI0006F3CE29|nr:hypothetical protein [Deinococcus sp. Leaf326]KQR37733.1 hypothetical protein ASF71_14730 [Deinococcus sp. Leaf326]
MTNGKPLNVIESFFYGGQWYHPGAKFPPAGTDVSAELVTRYTGTYLLSDRDLTKRENPQAHEAQAELAQAQDRVRELEEAQADFELLLGQFATEEGVPATVTHARVAIKMLQGESLALTGALALLGTKDAPLPVEDLPATLRSLLSDRQTLALTRKELTTFRALHPAAPGTDLPTSFLRRGPLVKAGLGTYESLQGKTAEQLDAVEGIEKENAVKIVSLVEAWTTKQAGQPAGEPQAGAPAPAPGETLPEGHQPPPGEPGDPTQGG